MAQPSLVRVIDGSNKLEEETEDLLSSFPVFSWNILAPLVEYPKKSKVADMRSVYVASAGLFHVLRKSIVKIGHAESKIISQKKSHIV